jgi:hypothetical protein
MVYQLKILFHFLKYNLQLRVFDIFGKCIYKYDPQHPDKNNKVCYGMVKRRSCLYIKSRSKIIMSKTRFKSQDSN